MSKGQDRLGRHRAAHQDPESASLPKEKVDALATSLAVNEQRFRAFLTATSDVVYCMSPDWTEMRHAKGQNFVPDTLEPSKTWLDRYIPKVDHPRVMEAIQRAIQSTGLFDLEHRVIRVDGSLGWTHSRAVPILDDRGEIVEWFGAARDITQRKEAEESLRQREQELSAIFNHTTAGIAKTDLTGRFLLVNERYCQILGRSPEEFSCLRMQDVTHPEDLPANLACFEKLLQEGTPFTIEKRCVRPDGALVWVRNDVSGIKDTSGKVIYVLAASVDITAAKAAEASLRESEERAWRQLREIDAIYSASPVGLVMFDLDFRFMRINDALAAMNGVPAAEHIGKRAHEVVPDIADAIYAVFRQVVETRQPVRFELRGKTPAAEDGVWDEHWYPLLGREGELVGVGAVVLDITARKQVEETLRQSREDLDRAQAIAHVGSWHLNVQRNELRWSDESYRIAGIPAGTRVTYESFLALVHPEDRAYVDRMWQGALRGEPYDIEHRFVVEGEVKWAREQAHLEFDADGNLLGAYGAFQDISERKRAEQALRDSEALLQSVLQQMPVGIGVMDKSGKWLITNSTMAALMPKAIPSTLPDQIARWRVVTDDGAIVPPQNWPGQRALRGESVFPGVDALYTAEDGRQRWMRFSASPLRSEQGEVIGATCVVQDVDAIKRAQDDIARSRDSMARLIEQCPFGIYIVDATFRILMMNKRSQEGAFVNVRPVIGRLFDEAISVLWPEKVAQEVIRAVRHTLESGEPFYSCDFVRPRADKDEVEGYEWELHQIVLPDGTRGVACYYYDSSELRRTEEALRRSEAQVTETLESISDGFFAVDAQWRFTYVNAAAERAVGMSREQMLGRTWQELYPPAINSRLESELRRCMEQKVPVELENFYPPWDRWFLCRAYPTPDGGHAQYFQDITERKRAEQALVESERRFRTMADSAPALIWVNGREGNEFVNRTYRKFLGVAEADVRGYDWARFIHPDDRDGYLAAYQLAVATQTEFRAEFRFRRHDGEFRWMHSAGQPRISSAGEFAGFCGITVDVTDRKRAEQELRESEDRYRAVVENQEEMLCRFRPDGTILFVNSAYGRSRGTTAAALVGQSFWQFVAAEDEPAVRRMLDRLSPTAPQVQIENRFETVDGERWTLWTNRALAFDADGRWTEVQSSGLDITDRKRAEETIRALLRISKRLNSTLEVEDLLDILVAEAVGLVGAESGVSGLATPEGLVCTRYFQNGRELTLEYCWPTMHGLPGWLLVHKTPYLTNDAASDPQIVQELVARFAVRNALSTPIITAQGEVIGFFELHNKKHPGGFTMSDRDLLVSVSQVAAIAVQNALAYGTIQHAEESLKEADRRKDEFLATLAHELRNPLAPIRSGLEVMRIARDDPATTEEIRKTMVRQTDQLVRLIDDLLDVSRITRGKLQLQFADTLLQEIIDSAVEATGPFIAEQGHQLTVDLPPEPMFLKVDRHRLAQVLANLLHNAAKYSPLPGPITLSAKREDKDVTLSVRDRGLGIPSDKLDEVFEMFAQIGRTGQKGYTGLGIGLTVAKSLVEMHGGTIEVHSDSDDPGTEFIVRIPNCVKRTDNGEPADDLEEDTLSLAKQRVLIVDDNQDAAHMLSLTVKLLGSEVRVAHDGVEAIEAAAEYRPEVVLLDLGMPRMDGYEVARHIRSAPWGKNMTLVALTGWGQDEDKRKTKEAGFDHHLVKPVDLTAVKAILAGLA